MHHTTPRRLTVTATLGPAATDDALLDRLADGADRFRLNGSHLDSPGLITWIDRLEALFDRRGQTTPVVLDLQGAKMRLGTYPTVATLPARVHVVLAESSGDPSIIPVPHPQLFEAAQPGETLVLNDARVALKVVEVRATEIVADVADDGPLSSRKGINRRNHPVAFGGLLARDRDQILASKHLSFIQYAFSFVYTGSEAVALRELVGRHHLVAKIERPEAFKYLSAIDDAFDETWLCRGDLGAQAGLERLGPLQAEYVRAMASLTGPAVLAGQVLHHMTAHTEPTRSEVVHLYDMAQAGWAGLVLSDETAVGSNPGRVLDLLGTLGHGLRAR